MGKRNVSIYKMVGGGFQTSIITPEGRRVRNKFETYKEAKVHAKTMTARLAERTGVVGSPLTALLVENYIRQNPQANIVKRSPYVFKFFMDRFGNRPIYEITKVHLVSWLDAIKEEKGYGSRTMLQCKYAFTPFFNSLVDEGILRSNPLSSIKIKMGTRIKQQVLLSEQDIMEILEGLKRVSQDLTFPVTYFLIHTGCKIGEALALKWEQVDLSEGTVTFPALPNSDGRTVRLSSNFLIFLKSWTQKSEHVFLDEHGRSWTRGRYGKRLARDRAHVGLAKHWDNFSFRYNFAYHFLRKGGTHQQLQVILGHRNIADTLAMYGWVFSQAEEKLSPYEK